MSEQKELTPQKIQQEIGMLNLRINDMMTQLNSVMKAMMEEIQNKDAKIKELQAPVLKASEAPADKLN